MNECVRQTGKKKMATSCTYCAHRKSVCEPLACWALDLKIAKLQDELAKAKLVRRKSAAGTITDVLLHSTKHLLGSKDDLSLNVETMMVQLQEDRTEFQSKYDTIVDMLRDLSIRPSVANSRPPVPPFDAPSPSVSTVSVASAASTSSDVNRVRLSLGPAIAAGPSGSGAGKSKGKGECYNTSEEQSTLLTVFGQNLFLQVLNLKSQHVLPVGMEGRPASQCPGLQVCKAGSAPVHAPSKGASIYSFCVSPLCTMYHCVSSVSSCELDVLNHSFMIISNV